LNGGKALDIEVNFMEVKDCKYCGLPEFWGEFRWKNGKLYCRRCYRQNWEDWHGRPYPWTDLDKTPFPTEKDVNK